VKKILQVALGIIAAIGGYLDIGDLVFNTEAGAIFGYQLLWTLPVGVLGIMVFAELSGRIAAIAGRANFDLVREQYGRRLGLFTLVASMWLSFLTLAAELGGMGLVLNLFFDVSGQAFMFVGVIVLIAAGWLLRFGAIERVFGYGGLALLVYVAGAVDLHPDWHAMGNGLVPAAQSSSLYAYFAVGLISAAMMPYEIYFYSSGGIEEGWTEKDLGVNRANAIIGYGLGALLAAGLMVISAEVFLPRGVEPASIGTTALATIVPFGETGLILGLIGIMFAVGGAAIDTGFSAAYNLAQYLGWDWGKRKGRLDTPRWTATWIAMFVGAYALIATGLDPIALTEYAVVLSAVAMPLTFLPVVRASNDRELMGRHVNGIVMRGLGWLYFAIVCVLAVAAPILLLATNGGGG
jgi:Mn2+/Fe2+ NRAMP family transporter